MRLPPSTGALFQVRRTMGARSCVPHVEELLELLSIDNVIDAQVQPMEEVPDTAMAISRSAISGGVSPMAFQLRAWIQGHEVLMLVDSGSSTSFINQQFASCLDGVQPLPRPSRVKVADGAELICSAVVPSCIWFTQGYEFTTNMKVLALGTYDAILGMDWLEEHGPMTVD